MSQEGPSWPHIPSSSSSTENVLGIHGPGLTQNTGKKKTQKETRQPLSCTRCRERKVKCDRTKPCSSCCARGVPKECHFVIAEGSTYEPVLQSYELRKLRAENLRLKERLRAAKQSVDDEQQDVPSPSQPLGDRPGARAKRPVVKQKRFKDNKSESLYFGSPGLASIVNDFASLHVGSHSLSHSMPRGADMYTSQNTPAYPFATMWLAVATPQSDGGIPALLRCLPPKEDLFRYLDAFQHRAQSCSFPHVPDEITTTEIERFLSDVQTNAEMFPDMLALIFAALALGSQNGVYDKCNGKWVEGAMETEQKKFGDIYIAAAMQALRMASFMNRPTLLGIQTLIMMGPYLTNSGRFLDAWTLFGTTIRLAHSIGLHRNPKYLDPAPPLKECGIRQTLWWWMLHMDQQYSMTLGRPLGISGIGDCPPAEPLTTNPVIVRLSEYINQYTVLARQILSSDRLTVTKIDWFTDRLLALWDTVPEMLQFDETWLEKDKQIPEWPLDAMGAVFFAKTQNYLILLNRQRIEPEIDTSDPPKSPQDAANPFHVSDTSFTPINAPITHHSPSDRTRMPPPPLPTQTPSTKDNPTEPKSRSARPKAGERGRSLVITSSRSLIDAFLFFYHRVPAALICWTMGQQAFNSCMILLTDALETGSLANVPQVERAYAVFVELEKLGIHKLAGLAVERVSWGLVELGKRQRWQRAEASQEAAMEEESGSGAAEGCKRPGLDISEHSPSDTVMGNTGMFLLEDPGLQSFVSESFQPLGWNMAGRDLRQSRQAPPQQQPPVSPFYTPQPSAPFAPFREDNTQPMSEFRASRMPSVQLPHQNPQEMQNQYHYQLSPSQQYQPSPSPQFNPQPFYTYEAQSRAPLRPLAPYPPHSASLPSLQEAIPHYGDVPAHLDIHNPDAMDMGGNPGWAARSTPGAGQNPAYGGSESRPRRGGGSGSGSGTARR